MKSNFASTMTVGGCCNEILFRLRDEKFFAKQMTCYLQEIVVPLRRIILRCRKAVQI